MVSYTQYALFQCILLTEPLIIHLNLGLKIKKWVEFQLSILEEISLNNCVWTQNSLFPLTISASSLFFSISNLPIDLLPLLYGRKKQKRRLTLTVQWLQGRERLPPYIYQFPCLVQFSGVLFSRMDVFGLGKAEELISEHGLCH